MGGTSTSELRVMSGKDRQVFRRARSHLGPGMRSLSLVGTTQAPPLGLKEAKVAPRNHLTLRKCKHTTSSFGRGWGGGGGGGDGIKEQHPGSFKAIVIFWFLCCRGGLGLYLRVYVALLFKPNIDTLINKTTPSASFTCPPHKTNRFRDSGRWDQVQIAKLSSCPDYFRFREN